MEIKVLGFRGSLQCADSSNTSLLVKAGDTSLLVDVSGSPCSSLLTSGIDPNDLDCVVITHAHIDHIYGFPSLLHNLWLRRRTKKLRVIAPLQAIECCKNLIKLFGLDKKSDLCEIEFEEASVNIVENIRIEAFSLFHRPHMTTFGYIFSSGDAKAVYFPDSAARPPYPKNAYGSDIVIHEAGNLDSIREQVNTAGHSTALQAAEVATELSASKLILVHLPPSDELVEAMVNEARSLFPNTVIPKVGSLFTLEH